MTEEKKILNKICKWLNSQDCEYYKVHGSSFQRAGEPDLTGAIRYKGYLFNFNFEVKTLKGKPTQLQLFRLDQWSKFDRVTGIVRSVEDIKELFDRKIEVRKQFYDFEVALEKIAHTLSRLNMRI